MNKIKPISAIVISSIVLSGCSGTQSIIDEYSSISSESSISTTISITESESQESTEISITETTEAELIIPDEYYEVIDSIVECVDNYDQNGTNTYIGNDLGNGVCDLCLLDNAKDLLAFAFVDIDGDKVAELAILDCGYTGDRLRITDLYTFYNDEVKHVCTGGTRSRYYLSSDMTIYGEGSSGGMYLIVIRYSFDPQLDELQFIDSYYTIPDDDLEGGFLCYTTYYSYILSSDFDSSYVELIDSFVFPSNIFEKYGIQEADLYDYGDITTLTEYCN